MIILISGTTHTGKTQLAQNLLESYSIPYLSIDHLKMGLIRSNNTALTPDDDEDLTNYLWPILTGIIQTAIENNQHLIIEGVYIPKNWKDSFTDVYLNHMIGCSLVMSESYINKNYEAILSFENIVENRLSSLPESKEQLILENSQIFAECLEYNLDYILIDESYNVYEQFIKRYGSELEIRIY